MASESAGDAQEWDVQKLREELSISRQTKAELVCRKAKFDESVRQAERMLVEVPAEETAWSRRYHQQLLHNRHLQAELRELESSLAELQTGSRDVTGGGDYSDMSDASLRQLLRRLDKERAELEWQLRDCEWRLDQEATSVHKSEEEKAAVLTALDQASLELDKCNRPAPPVTGGGTSCRGSAHSHA